MIANYAEERIHEEINYIRQNPGASIEAVAKHLADKNLSSRITVRNDLAALEAKNSIIMKKDSPRSQRYRLFINEKNIFIKVMSEMHEFKENYFALLKTMKMEYRQIKSKRVELAKSRSPLGLRPGYDNITLAWFIYNNFIGMYLFKAVFTWQKIQDIETVNKLYQRLFETTREINNQLSELDFGDAEVSKISPEQMDYLFNRRVGQYIKLDPLNLEYLLEVCSSLGLYNAMEPVVDSLWKIGSDSVSKSMNRWKHDNDFSELSTIQNPEDWREVVRMVKKIKNEKKLRYIIDFS